MKRYLPFIIIALVAVLTVAGGAILVRANRRALAATAPSPAATPTGPAELKPAHSVGPESAPVTLEEFGDFQCQSCARTSALIRGIKNELGARLRVVFWQFPLPMHEHAREAAIAAEAASAQGRFWEFHDLLYQNQSSWSHAPDISVEFDKLATQLSLDVERFRQELHSRAAANRVDAEQEHGKSRGVKATPTLFVNGRECPPPFTPERLREAINAALAKGKNP